MLQIRHDIVGLRLYFRGGMNYLKDKVTHWSDLAHAKQRDIDNWFVFDGRPKQALWCGHSVAEVDGYLRSSILLALGKKAAKRDSATCL